MTPMWQRAQDRLLAALLELREDDQFRAALEALMNELDASPATLGPALPALAGHVRASLPELTATVGEYLEEFLLLFASVALRAARGLPSEEIDQAMADLFPAMRLAHLSPDNPIRLGADGWATVPPFPQERHLYELRDYWDSMRPAGRPGRPRGQTPAATSGRRRIDPEIARRAAALKAAGSTWPEIARIVCPDLDLSRAADQARARSRVNSAVQRGRILEDSNRA